MPSLCQDKAFSLGAGVDEDVKMRSIRLLQDAEGNVGVAVCGAFCNGRGYTSGLVDREVCIRRASSHCLGPVCHGGRHLTTKYLRSRYLVPA